MRTMRIVSLRSSYTFFGIDMRVLTVAPSSSEIQHLTHMTWLPGLLVRVVFLYVYV